MTYETMLREMFQGIDLQVEDIYLLERFQIAYLPDRVPQREFAALLWANASIKRFLITKYPPIADFIDDVLARYGPAADQQELDAYIDRLVWEIADHLIYVKRPDAYDERAAIRWDFGEATSDVSIKDKIVIDAGAGTGRIAFAAAQSAHIVFAVEPVTSMRRFIREKAAMTGITNLYAIDGFLHAVPLPDRFADVVITSNAIGWQLEAELEEIERVVKQGGYAIHLFSSPTDAQDAPLDASLTSSEWQYTCSRRQDQDSWRIKYWKQI